MFTTLIVEPIFNLLLGLYSIVPGGDFGVTIVIFTIIFRLALWPLIKKQLHQSKAMRKMQPELVKIKQQAKGDKQKEGMLMMELYKKHDVHPFRSMGILLIQLPIFIALYRVIRILALSRAEVANYTYDFLENIGPIKELITNPDHFNNTFLGFIDLTDHAIVTSPTSINVYLLILAIVAAVVQYIIAKQVSPNANSSRKLKDIMNEAAEGKKVDQSEINAAMTGKMSFMLPVMMLLIMVSVPGALVLYYATSNLVAVIQQSIILNKDKEEMIEIADKADSKLAKAKQRAKVAKEATVVHKIKAKDDRKKEKKS